MAVLTDRSAKIIRAVERKSNSRNAGFAGLQGTISICVIVDGATERGGSELTKVVAGCGSCLGKRNSVNFIKFWRCASQHAANRPRRVFAIEQKGGTMLLSSSTTE